MDRVVIERLWQSEAAKAPAPSTPMWLFPRFSTIRVVFAASADAKAAAP